jgi:hypothetical protein
MRRLISGELTIYSVVRTSPEPLQDLLSLRLEEIAKLAEHAFTLPY